MKQRILFILLAAVIGLTAVVSAQPRQGQRGNREEAQVNQLKEKVGLTEEQAAKVKAILVKVREDVRAKMEKNEGDREARREAMMQSMEKSDAEIQKVLTKEQKVKYEEFKKDRQKMMEERRRERQ